MFSVALLGVGSLRCSPAVIASLASVKTEIDLRLFDTNREFLDLYRRFSDLCLGTEWNANSVACFTDVEAAIEGAHAVILLDHTLQQDPEIAQVLDLADWPPQLGEEATRSLPHQLLRWISEEESVWRYVDEHRGSPVNGWIAETFPHIEFL